jgi:hypothetical protein
VPFVTVYAPFKPAVKSPVNVKDEPHPPRAPDDLASLRAFSILKDMRKIKSVSITLIKISLHSDGDRYGITVPDQGSFGCLSPVAPR